MTFEPDDRNGYCRIMLLPLWRTLAVAAAVKCNQVQLPKQNKIRHTSLFLNYQSCICNAFMYNASVKFPYFLLKVYFPDTFTLIYLFIYFYIINSVFFLVLHQPRILIVHYCVQAYPSLTQSTSLR